MVLNGRLLKTTARAVLSILVFGGRSSAQRANNLPRVETFPGAACSTKFALGTRRDKYRGFSWVRSKAAPLQALCNAPALSPS